MMQSKTKPGRNQTTRKAAGDVKVPGKTAAYLPLDVRVYQQPLDYDEAVALQQSLVAQRLADAIPDTMLLLEHKPVITLGVSAREEHLMLSVGKLAALGIGVVRSARGGDVTYHGPGQLVAYPILKLTDGERDVRKYVHRLEETAIRTAAAFGISAWRRPGMTGAWTDAGKLAAIGVRVRRWVTFHGVSFNMDPVPDGFRFIVPCGLAGEPVTSLRHILAPAAPPSLDEVRQAWREAFAAVFHRG